LDLVFSSQEDHARLWTARGSDGQAGRYVQSFLHALVYILQLAPRLTLSPLAFPQIPSHVGELNYTHSRLLANSQEIALYNSSEIEKNIVERSFYALIKHLNSVIRVKGWYSMGEEGIVKFVPPSPFLSSILS
jgi:ABC-type uncharacterized transport system fused permease/ATPase subunit